MADPKSLRFTRHAEDVILERRLDRSWIERTVRQPDWSRPDPFRPGVERRFRRIPEFGDRVLRVACAEAEHEIRILTIFFERAETVMTPKVKYSPEDNAAYIRLSQQDILESAEVAPGVVFDYDAEGRIVGIELLDARAQLSPEVLTEAA
ncbi:DUF2283 domain-containing protein [Pseudorhodoplanes sp.]|uniref:DUF2283 domain-containing protein n=1 Tax=Pseudorhodoplanes sp. TaxID=1934341 RepID=UPI00391DEA27